MKICTKVKGYTSNHDEPIAGHIYEAQEKTGLSWGQIGIIVQDHTTKKLFLVSLTTGEQWSTTSPFGTSVAQWKDVTHKYCLKEVE